MKSGLKHHDPTLLAVLPEKEDRSNVEIPRVIQSILRELSTIMPNMLPKELPSKQPVVHAIKLVSRAKPPGSALYRMSPLRTYRFEKIVR